MPVHRPIVRSILFTLAAVACSSVAASVADAHAQHSRSAAPPQTIVFPVVGRVSYSDDFGEPRPQGGHPGNDILAARHAPVVAAEPGRIAFWTTSATAGCMLYLYGQSGTTYQYIHLNNDLTRHNDNRGSCVPGVAYAAGLQDGDEVRAGELIGYVGDSGDADGRHPHLHFELHPGGGAAVSPYQWLLHAERLARPAGSNVPSVAVAVASPKPAMLG
jgi:murein DD-endopeptidase MepM/ murein hydrolase activator NlpD